jgi:hypothetical protein
MRLGLGGRTLEMPQQGQTWNYPSGNGPKEAGETTDASPGTTSDQTPTTTTLQKDIYKLNKNELVTLRHGSTLPIKQSTTYSMSTTKHMTTPTMTHSQTHPAAPIPRTLPNKVCPHRQVVKQAKFHQISLPRQRI